MTLAGAALQDEVNQTDQCGSNKLQVTLPMWDTAVKLGHFAELFMEINM